MRLRLPLAAALGLALSLSTRASYAGSKEECVEAHGRGQDLRERGQLAAARQAFMTCAQSSCPSIVQADCSRLSEDIGRLVPTVSFVARDANASDLPATSVYVDDVLVATRLDDGQAYEIDPGKHTVRYLHDGRETTMKVVLNQGERGRVLIATFAAPSSPPPSEAGRTSETVAPALTTRRSAVPLFVAGLGVAALGTGAAIFAMGMGKVPSNCDVSTHECATRAGDPSLGEARSGMSLANVGLATGIAGGVFLLGGLLWYALERPHLVETTRSASNPYGRPFAVAF